MLLSILASVLVAYWKSLLSFDFQYKCSAILDVMPQHMFRGVQIYRCWLMKDLRSITPGKGKMLNAKKL